MKSFLIQSGSISTVGTQPMSQSAASLHLTLWKMALIPTTSPSTLSAILTPLRLANQWAIWAIPKQEQTRTTQPTIPPSISIITHRLNASTKSPLICGPLVSQFTPCKTVIQAQPTIPLQLLIQILCLRRRTSNKNFYLGAGSEALLKKYMMTKTIHKVKILPSYCISSRLRIIHRLWCKALYWWRHLSKIRCSTRQLIVLLTIIVAPWCSLSW